jgi:hypothetical protein
VGGWLRTWATLNPLFQRCQQTSVRSEHPLAVTSDGYSEFLVADTFSAPFRSVGNGSDSSGGVLILPAAHTITAGADGSGFVGRPPLPRQPFHTVRALDFLRAPAT